MYLVYKTAIAGEDANWGRIIMAIGKSGEKANRDEIKIYIGEELVTSEGMVDKNYSEKRATEHLKQKEIIDQLRMQTGIIKTLDKDIANKGTYGTESDYLVWVYNKGTENEEVYLQLPIIQVKLSNYAKSGPLGFADDGLRDVSATGAVTNFESSKYINDYDAVLINEEIEDTARNETIYKMPLPKELQKEILSKPKKMSKIKGQSTRLFA